MLSLQLPIFSKSDMRLAEMDKMHVVKTWKPDLRKLGFAFKQGMFQFLETEQHPLHLIISIQKHQRTDRFKINPTIIIKNPLLHSVSAEVLVMGNVRQEGIRLHVTAESWWAPQFLGQALS